jgi:hypothetical protein
MCSVPLRRSYGLTTVASESEQRNVESTYVCLWYSSVTARQGRQMATPVLVKKFPAFHVTRKFNAAFTTACPHPEPQQSTPRLPIPLLENPI